MTPRDPKEISRLKQSRRNALLNLTAKRLGVPTWQKFSTQFVNALSALPPDADQAQVNAAIDALLSKALDHLTAHGAQKNTADHELSAVFKKNPRLRPWNTAPKKKP